MRDIKNKFEKFGTFDNIPKRHRRRCTDQHSDLNIIREITRSPKKTPSMIRSNLNLNCSLQTIRRRIKEKGLRARVSATVPFISVANQKKRKQWTQRLLKYPKWFWNRVVWSDEKKFELMGAKKRVIVYRKVGQRYKLKHVNPSMKHGGGSIMVWGCFSAFGVGSLHLINGIMNQHIYRDILVDELQFSVDLMGIGDRFVFQQDLDPKHTAPAPMKFFTENNISVLDWSPQSPDVNVIENLWSYLDRAVPPSKRKNRKDFFVALTEAWHSIDPSVLKKLVDSVPKRLIDVIKSKGGPTGN